MEALVIIAAFVVILYFALVMQRRRERQRTETVSTIATSMNFSFSAEADESLLKTLEHFHLFSQGRSRQIRNVMQRGDDEAEIAIFDYRYTTGSGKNSHTWRQTVMLFQAADVQLPSFALRPERFFHKIGGVFGYQDIDFDSYPTFSSRYLLRGEDEMRVRSVFGPDVLRHFEQLEGVSTEAGSNQLIYYRASKRVAPEKVGEFLQEGLQVLKLFKK